MEKLDNFITLREASKLSGYNPDYLGYLIRTGKLNGRKIGRNWMTTTEDVKFYLANLSPLAKITRKPVNFKIAIFTILISVTATFALYYFYTVIYENAYSQAASQQKNIENNVEQILQ